MYQGYKGFNKLNLTFNMNFILTIIQLNVFIVFGDFDWYVAKWNPFLRFN